MDLLQSKISHVLKEETPNATSNRTQGSQTNLTNTYINTKTKQLKDREGSNTPRLKQVTKNVK